MPGFWESALTSTYRAFAAGDPGGRSHVAWWIDQAIASGLLDCARLETGSLCLIVFSCPPDTPIRTQAVERLCQVGLAPLEIGSALVDLQRPEVGDLLLAAAMDKGDITREVLHFDVLWHRYGASLIRFLERLYLVDAAVVNGFALKLVRDTYSHWDYPASLDFVCELYRRCGRRIPVPGPGRVPCVPPGWFKPDTPEAWFLERSLRLSFTDRFLLFATLYARLDVREIADVLRSVVPACNPNLVSRELRQAWAHYFQ